MPDQQISSNGTRARLLSEMPVTERNLVLTSSVFAGFGADAEHIVEQLAKAR